MRTLALLILGAGLVAFLLAGQTPGRLELPLSAPVTVALLAVAEFVGAKVVRDRLAHRVSPRGRPLHPLQVARAAALAKASSPAGAVLLGAYGGLAAWTLPRRDSLPPFAPDPLVVLLSAVACLALVVAALLLERACRTPQRPGGVEAPG